MLRMKMYSYYSYSFYAKCLELVSKQLNPCAWSKVYILGQVENIGFALSNHHICTIYRSINVKKIEKSISNFFFFFSLC